MHMKSRTFLITGLVIGIILALGPLWGMAFTMIFMLKAFSEMGRNGIADPARLSHDIGHTLVSTSLGIFACPVGLVLAIICAVFLVRSPKTTPPSLPTQQVQG